jgi:hypothetical protein
MRFPYPQGEGKAFSGFCGITGESPQEIAANVANTPEFKRIEGTALYEGYFDRAALVTLTVTTSANKAHPAVACRRALQKNNAWSVVTEIRCAASESACKAMLSEFELLDQQMRQAIERENP